ncbi:MAG: hypothetical protein NZ529_00085 [Cytophagaceae bacterium]|nr:hypothetical protein [Cytophagaceae bacterium]MDW8455164.1 hypothetical protein [Cytophagaceae bacterium]
MDKKRSKHHSEKSAILYRSDSGVADSPAPQGRAQQKNASS